MVREPPCYATSVIEHLSEAGSMHLTRERPRTSLSLPWPTSSHASPGLCSPAATTTDPSPHKQQGPPERPKVSHRSLPRSSKDERTVITACPQPDPENGLQTTDRLRRTDTRATHHGQEN